MREVFENLYCGNENDFKVETYENGTEIRVAVPVQPYGLAVIHACKEPYHRQFVGYTGRGCPKDHPEYLWAERGNRLALNIVDAPKPEFFAKEMIDKALDFIEKKLEEGLKVFVHCNQGESRSPSLCLLYLIKNGITQGETLEDCEAEFLKVYPKYNPGAGMREFVKSNFKDYFK